jgi:bla regulator protein blaR1
MMSQATLANLSPLANHLWQSTLCVAAVWLLTLTLKKNHAAVRYWLWLAASVKFLIPFSLLVSLGSQLPFSWRTAPAMTIAQTRWSSVVENIGRPFVASAPALSAVTPTAHGLLPTILLAVWFCGFLTSIVRWFRGWGQIRAARKQASPLALSLPIPVMSSTTLMEPGVFGIRKPVLLLPEGIADRLTPEQLNAVLAHEMCHVRRRDNLTAAIHMVVEAVFWFYPLVWWIRARLVEERERACDEAVLQSGSDAEIYAEGILNVCRFYIESPISCVSGISGADLKKRIVRIMTQRLADRLSLGRKVLLAAIMLVAIAGPFVGGIVNAPQVLAQISPEPTGQAPSSFEVVSIKPNRSDDGGVSFQMLPGRFTATGFTVEELITQGYGLDDTQISGAPTWIHSEKYDIDAKIEDSMGSQLQSLPPDQRQQRVNPMIQSLLADRFKLKVSHETKESSVYVLVVAKGGTKLHEAKPGDIYANGMKRPDGNPIGRSLLAPEPGKLVGQGVPIATLVRVLSRYQLGRIVLDKTGLAGEYDFTLQWTPEDGHAPMSNEAEGGQADAGALSPHSGPSIFTAIQEQLGLKLESTKAPVEVLVIDHVERPSPN